MNSDMSKRTSDFSLPNRNSASRRATSVLPTPVGPRNRKHPTGRPGAFSPARLRRMARASAVMALSWLMTRLCSSGSMRSSFCCSSSLMEVTATPVQRDTTSSMSSRVTMPVVESSSFSRSRKRAQVFFLLALFFGIETRLLEFVVGDGRFHPVRDELHALLHLGHFLRQRRLAQLDARARSSIRSMALSGRKRSGM